MAGARSVLAAPASSVDSGAPSGCACAPAWVVAACVVAEGAGSAPFAFVAAGVASVVFASPPRGRGRGRLPGRRLLLLVGLLLAEGAGAGALNLLGEALAHRLGLAVVGLAREHLVEDREGALQVPLRRIDLGERHRGQRRRRRGPAALFALLAQHARGFGQVEPAVDDPRQQIASAAEPAACLGALALVLGRGPDDLIDELGLCEDTRAWNSEAFGLDDQLLPRHPLEILPVHKVADPTTATRRWYAHGGRVTAKPLRPPHRARGRPDAPSPPWRHGRSGP
jgi:hypothetical protein